jgi:uncharacterized membrane protein YkoI
MDGAQRMKRVRKTAIGVGAVAALGLAGGAIAGAAGGDTRAEGPGDAPDVVVTGDEAAKAGDAARGDVGGGRVTSVERTDEAAPAYYEVKVDDGGTVWEVQVSRDFAVTARKHDD